tara:strand:- start:607 stop:1422 length:816 start_codon:yes stop_codon:yes gene_type:complete
MAIAIELMGERRMSVSENGLSATRTFHVKEATSEADVIDLMSVEETDVLPYIGSVHPALDSISVAGFEINLVTNHSDLWKVAFNYDQGEGGTLPGDDKEDPTLPTTPGYIEYSATVSGSFDNFYMDPQTVNLNKEGMLPSEHIGGTPISQGPHPISAPRSKIDFVVRVVENIDEIEWTKIRTMTGTRNESDFEGLEAEYAVYLGATAQRVSLTNVSVSHKFQYDQFKHLVQQPYRLPSGDIGTSSESRPKIVCHIQPFNKLSDFTELSQYF